MVTTTPTPRSTWIRSISYHRGYLILFLRGDGGTDGGSNTALLYGPSVPSWAPGLLMAGTGRRSVGLAYVRLVKGKYPYQRVEGIDKVRSLRKMMND